MLISELLKESAKLNDQTVEFIARVRSHRQGKAVSFVVVNDGTSVNDVQVVYKAGIANESEVQKIRISTIIAVTGKLVLTPGKPQPFEIVASEIKTLDQAIEDYPLQKKEHSPEFLREIAHLRARTKKFNAIFRIRSEAAFAIHSFFNEKGFLYVNSPILTSNDAEGAGEAFVVTAREDAKYEDDFFGKKASLTVSGQLNAEAYAQAFRNVYTFGPTFRAENSNTSKHAAEFWMVEPEIAFCDLQDDIKVIGDLLKFVIKQVMAKCADEIAYCDENLEPGLIKKLEAVLNSQYIVMTYQEVITTLQKAIKDGHKFEENNVEFGLDLGTEHERYICEVINNAPTFVTNYPKDIKAFYMKQNDDGKTVAAVDLLVPGIGELVGGSQREDDYDKLIRRCNEMGINSEELAWYIDLRQYGYYKSAGFGLGFERLIMYLTGAGNIRDVLPFPRTPKNLQF
jgi:asparaginyl-tRNA synthetase